jgi:hypothetical protein
MIRLILNYGGIVLGIFGIAATAYFARRYSEKKRPRFYTTTELKIARSEDAPDDIAISYKGKNVARVYSTIVWFWNAGRKPLKSEDLRTSQPLEIRLKDENESLEILDVSVPKTSREAIRFKAQKCDNACVSVGFDFIDHNDGGVIEIMHTGSLQTHVNFSGIILGAPEGVKKIGRRKMALFFPYSSHVFSRRGVFYLLFKVTFSVFITIIFGGLIYLLLSSTRYITTSESLLMSQLKDFISNQDLHKAVDTIVLNSKYKSINDIMANVMIGIFTLNLIVGYFISWRSPFPFPISLALSKPKTKKNNEGLNVEENAEKKRKA